MERIPHGFALVSSDAGVSLHRQLFLVLHDEIGRGALGPGDALPTEQSLCEQFGVSRITVRRALADLADAGLIERRHGIGSFVAEQPTFARPDAESSYYEEVRHVDFVTGAEVVEYGIGTMPRMVADRLGWGDQGLHVLRLRRERSTGEPLMITEGWLPVRLADSITEAALGVKPLRQLVEEAGVSVERLEHELTAEVAGPRTGSMLGVAIGTPLVRVNTVEFVAGSPHHMVSLILSPSRSRILLNQTSAELATGVGMSVAHDVHRPTS